ncbi:hypothetical protein Tco_0664084 [Tanacetum coccineum]
MVPLNKLEHVLNGKAINKTQYRGMIGSLMYLTASRSDIQFSTCLCVRYQVNPKESHLMVVKRISRCNMDMKSTSEIIFSKGTLKRLIVELGISMPTSDIYGEVGVNTFRNAIGAHYFPHFREYVTPPSIDILRPWFKTIRYGEIVLVKGTLKKSLLPPKWRLLMAQIIQCLGGKTRGFDQITNKDAIILYSLVNEININFASIF